MLIMRETLIAGNWKMHKTLPEAIQFVEKILPGLRTDAITAWIAPPFTALHACSQAARGSALKIGGQNLSEHESGAFTGEISGKMLADAGASFVIIGHSERRQLFHETGAQIATKLTRALDAGLVPILCIGETAEERQWGHTHQVLARQLEEALHATAPARLFQLVVAYEPVWAIGTGQTATPEIAQEAHHWIRGVLGRLLGGPLSDSLRLLYGGSVKPSNIGELLRQPDIDGALVGGASLEVDSFLQLIHFGSIV